MEHTAEDLCFACKRHVVSRNERKQQPFMTVCTQCSQRAHTKCWNLYLSTEGFTGAVPDDCPYCSAPLAAPVPLGSPRHSGWSATSVPPGWTRHHYTTGLWVQWHPSRRPDRIAVPCPSVTGFVGGGTPRKSITSKPSREEPAFSSGGIPRRTSAARIPWPNPKDHLRCPRRKGAVPCSPLPFRSHFTIQHTTHFRSHSHQTYTLPSPAETPSTHSPMPLRELRVCLPSKSSIFCAPLSTSFFLFLYTICVVISSTCFFQFIN
jgi:hypothetical protein